MTHAPKPDVCLACGHDTPHDYAVVVHDKGCEECEGRCTADRRTIAAQAKRIEELEAEVELLNDRMRERETPLHHTIEEQRLRIDALAEVLAKGMMANPPTVKIVLPKEADHD